MSRYLVTGAQGFTGRFVVADLLAADPQAHVIGTGRSARSDTAFTHSVTWNGKRVAAPLTAELTSLDAARYTYEACDLGDAPGFSALLTRERVDVVIHLAAALRDDPADKLLGANVAGPMAMYSAIAALERKPRVIFGSSGATYGPTDTVPVAETQRSAPVEPYAMSKLSGEYVAKIASKQYGIATTFGRIFNIAGPGQDERHVCGRFASQVAAIAAGIAPPRMEIGDLRPTRDFVDVRDVAAAMRILAQSGVAGETYNVASGRETAIDEVFRRTLAIADLAGTVEVVEKYARADDVSRQYADIAKIAALGYVPKFTLEATMRDLYAYYFGAVAAAA